ncbi:hypothetical protein [Persephonella sp. KM09-Lau-8]|uniref:hypothetical protein n=1 Tax=Persephonella sp. KM09-Lau-8 TaxID=1158345 RepID=UPI0004980503|nr:hypothetical protein [Persephonella sp. KM09-Lau-8]
MKKLVYGLLLTFFLVLTGCEDKPSDELVKKQLESLSIIGEVKNYKRINGYKDGNYYIVEYEYDLYIDKQKIKELSNKMKGSFFSEIQLSALLMGIVLQCGSQNPCHIKEKAKFVKGEKGWSVVEE